MSKRMGHRIQEHLAVVFPVDMMTTALTISQEYAED